METNELIESLDDYVKNEIDMGNLIDKVEYTIRHLDHPSIGYKITEEDVKDLLNNVLKALYWCQDKCAEDDDEEDDDDEYGDTLSESDKDDILNELSYMEANIDDIDDFISNYDEDTSYFSTVDDRLNELQMSINSIKSTLEF